MSRDLTTAHVIVLGATGALGSRIVSRLTDAGANVLATGRDEAKLQDLASSSPTVRTVTADLRDYGAVKLIADAADDQVTGIVNAAGVVAFGDLQDLDDAVLDTLFMVNTLSPMRVMSSLLPRVADGGFVAHLTGVIAGQPMAGLAAYGASKAALAASLTALRREVRKRKIDVIDLRLPHTETGLVTRSLSGDAPKLPEGADPDVVVPVIIEQLRQGAREVGPDAFSA